MANNIIVQLARYYPQEFVDQLNDMTNSSILVTTEDTADCQILVQGVPTEEQITKKKNLQAVIIPWAGLPKKTKALMEMNPHIAVHNLHHNAIPVSEIAFAMMFSLVKRLPLIENNFRKNNWVDRYDEKTEISILKAKRVLILGYGEIGKLLETYCKNFEMNVNIIRKNPKQNDSRQYALSEIDTLLPETDVVFISLPLTNETKGLFDKQRLSLLPQGAILINIARGGIIDEEALYNALKEKKISAGIDTWYNYPQDDIHVQDVKPSEYPFHELNNLIMTPHLGGHTKQTEQLRAEHLAILLNEFADGTPMRNKVDLERGY